MGIGERNAGGVAMMAEQGTQSGSGHACSARPSFQGDEQGGGTGIGPLQPQIVIQQLNGLRGQRKQAKFVALAAHSELGFGKQCVLRIQSQNFGGPQSLEKH